MRSGFFSLRGITLMAVVSPVFSSEQTQDDNGCIGGTCPFKYGGDQDKYSGTNKVQEPECGLWMGPSPIKQAEDHGFGLGIFTGKTIPAGSAVEMIYGHGELLLPIYNSEGIYEEHPPLREYTWGESNLPEIAAEYPFHDTALLVPGLASIAPCTSENYNLMLGSERGWSTSSDDGGVHRASHPHAGAFSYRHNVTYIAVRDIAAGEELTVNCDDENFDGGAYYLSLYESSKNDDRVTCLDQNLRVDKAIKNGAYADNRDDPMGLGLFAKRSLAKGEPIISSPLTPIHRDVLEVMFDDPVNDKQLMLNYVFGHPDSDLLLLPIGPMVNFINHRRKSNGGANAEIRWHHLDSDGKPRMNAKELKGYHDIELFDLSGEAVAQTHGRGLVMDIVALKDISEGEEVYLDYGDEWQAAWDTHVVSFEKLQKRLSKEDREYISAARQVQLEKKLKSSEDNTGSPASFHYRIEAEEVTKPYPENMEFFCFYSLDDDDDVDDEDEDEDEDEDNPDDTTSLRKIRVDASEEPKRFSWEDHSQHSCFRPCELVERNQDDGNKELTYTVELFPDDNIRVQEDCWIGTKYIIQDVPQSEIRLLDKPYSTDVLSTFAFRHEIGVPEGFYPESWMAKKKRLRRSGNAPEDGTPSNYKKTKQSGEEKVES